MSSIEQTICKMAISKKKNWKKLILLIQIMQCICKRMNNIYIKVYKGNLKKKVKKISKNDKRIKLNKTRISVMI